MTDINKNKLVPAIKIFKDSLDVHLINTVDNKVILSLANMLAMHFSDAEENDLKEKSEECSSKVSNYLGKRVIASYDFGIVMGLFAVAITNDIPIRDQISENIEAIKDLDVACNEILSDYENDMEIEEVRSVLKDIIGQKDNIDIINYISNNKKKIKEIYNKAKENKATSAKDLTGEMSRIFRELSKKSSVFQDIKNTFTMVGSIAAGAGIAAACVVTLGVLAPVLIIPATVIGAKVFANVAESAVSPVINILTSDIARKSINNAISNQNALKPIKEKASMSEINAELAAEAAQITHNKIKQTAPPKKEHSEEIKKAAEALKKKVERQV